jgi:hypothetical protein
MVIISIYLMLILKKLRKLLIIHFLNKKTGNKKINSLWIKLARNFIIGPYVVLHNGNRRTGF